MVLFGDTAMTSEDAAKYLKEVDSVYSCEVDGSKFVSDLKASIR